MSPVPAPPRGVDEAFDGRLTQAVSNRDPTLGASEAIWTQHTVRGRGGRAELRWYELDPERFSVLRRGAIAKRRSVWTPTAASKRMRPNMCSP